MNLHAAYCQYSIISVNNEDSCFCVSNYPFFDFKNKVHIVGVIPPDSIVSGKDISIVELGKKIQEATYEHFKDSISIDTMITMDILVDKEGYVRGAVTSISNSKLLRVATFAFDLFRQEEFNPAYNRGKPINYTFYWLIRFPCCP